MNKKQTIENQQGEIKFRKLLFQQQVIGDQIFEDEYDLEGIKKILKDRMNKTYADFLHYKGKGLRLSPYLELGSERGQRALVMENDLGARGAAIDISFHMLKSCKFFSELFDKHNIPLRICCDLYDLPFKSGSIPFMFCYATLHHFPNLIPVIYEIHRVLADGGNFFFGGEPFRRSLHINVYSQKNKIYSKEYLDRHNSLKVLDHLFSDIVCNEEDYNIIENKNISLQHWKEALQCFDKNTVKLSSFGNIEEDLYNPHNLLKYFFAFLLGGRINGLCQKASEKETLTNFVNIYECLICPHCKSRGYENSVLYKDDLLLCDYCGKTYLKREGVFILLSDNKMKQLYPEFNT